MPSHDFNNYFEDIPLVYAERLRGLRVMNTRYLSNDMVEVEMNDGRRYRLYRTDFEYGCRDNYFQPYAAHSAYGQSGHTAGGAGGASPMQPGTFQMQPGGVTTQSPLTTLAHEQTFEHLGSRVLTTPADKKPSAEKPRNTLKQVYYRNRLRKK